MEIKKRVIYADLLRVFSAFAVIILHVAATPWYKYNIHSTSWGMLNVIDSSVRWCVPVFFMLSGMFMLNPNKDILNKTLYRKNILKLLFLLFITALGYDIFISILDGNIINMSFITKSIKNIILGNVRYHLWFLYQIIGLYILTPIIRSFIRGATKKDIEYCLIIGFIFSILVPTMIKFYPFSTILTTAVKLNVYIGYAFYYLSGYYLSKYTLDKLIRNILYGIGIVSLIFTIVATYQYSLIKGNPQSVFYEYLTPNVMFMSFAIFIVFKQINKRHTENNIVNKGIVNLSKYTLGIYIIHDGVKIFLEKINFIPINTNVLIYVPLQSIIIFIISGGIIISLKKINVIFKVKWLKSN